MPARSLRSAFTTWLRRHAIRAVAIGALGSALAVAGCSQLAHKERELVFRVVPGTASWYSGLPTGVVEANLPVESDGKTQHIHTWWWPSAKPDAPALLYLHGARWNLTGQAFRIEQLHQFGFSVLAIDYRGFGKSDGELPSEETAYEDARAAWKHLTQLQPDPAKRFIYGHSLGGAIAVDLAASLSAEARQASAHGLIVESSFTTLADIARTFTYPWLPLQLLMSQKFESVEKISRVRMPVLVVHGTDDRYVPSRFSQQLFDAAPNPKRLLLVEGGTHNNSMRIGKAEYLAAVRGLFGWAADPS
jgi:alpha-beta hydrolase superfamily lysophospholipase